MREVLFRGKQIDNGDWIEGYYLKADWNGKEISAIIPQNTVLYSGNTIDSIIEIDPKTLCQYTGMNDKKGKWIWENDIVYMKNKDKKSFVSEKFLQDAYLKLASKYGIAVALEEIDKELKKIDSSYEVVAFVEKLLCDLNMKFKIELLMFPNWATNNKIYVINKEYYTHIKIKGNLLEVIVK